MNRIYFIERNTSNSAKYGIHYDQAYGFVIIAANEHDARLIASQEKGDEDAEVWLNPKLSICVEINPDKPRMVIRDYKAG